MTQQSIALSSLSLEEELAALTSTGGKVRNKTRHQKPQTLNPEFVQTVAAVVQNVLAGKEFSVFQTPKAPAKRAKKVAPKKAPAQGQKAQLVLVQEPFYAKNGDTKLPMITQGAERNVPVELSILKVVGDKVITLERFRARFPQYIQVRKVVNHNGQKVLGLREIPNAEFETADQAKQIMAKIVASLS